MKFSGITLLIIAAALSNVDARYDENEGRPKKFEIDAFRIKMSEKSSSYTSGSLQIGMRQGITECTTSQELLSRPYAMELYVIAEQSKFGQCIGKLFKPGDRNPIQLRVLSNSGNNAYLEKVGVKLGGDWFDWTGFEVMVDHGDPTDWQTVYKSGVKGGSPIQEIAIQMTNYYWASTGGNLRVEVKQGSHTDCETATNLLIAPKKSQFYRIVDTGKFGSCIETKFNPKDRDNIQIRVLGSSTNDAYIDSVKVKIDGKWYGWTGDRVHVDYGDPTDWRNVHEMAI